MAEQLTLSISKKNKEACIIVEKWRKNGMNVSDILCEYVVRYDKELQTQNQKETDS